jgi:hypothetical protein
MARAAVKAKKPAAPGRRIQDRGLLDAVIAAYHAARTEAAGRDDPVARYAGKILEAVFTAVRDGDQVALRQGTKWARTVASGGRAPMSELVRDLYAIALDGGGPAVVSADSALRIIASGLFDVGADLSRVAARIGQRLAGLVERDTTDPELWVKAVLRAVGMTEKGAGNAITAARALLHTAERPSFPPTVPKRVPYTRSRM